jgi:hypothetical protein
MKKRVNLTWMFLALMVASTVPAQTPVTASGTTSAGRSCIQRNCYRDQLAHHGFRQ